MSEFTFKQRVEKFWNWYAEVADRFYKTIEDGECGSLAREVSDSMGQLLPGFAWVFGPGPDGRGGHAFTMSGDGALHYQFLAEYWLSRAPELEGWTFHASRQPAELHPEQAFDLGEFRFEFGQMFFSGTIDEDNKRLDIDVYHPLFASVDEQIRGRVTFLVLDEVLGEYGTSQWIGGVEMVTEEPSDGRSILQLRDAVHDLEIQPGWQKYPPTEAGTVYEINIDEDQTTFPRSDTTIGSTVNDRLISDFLNSEGQYEDPIPDTGADFVYVEFSTSIVPQGEEVAFRCEIEDTINDRLQAEFVGGSIGGAFGLRNTYVDFLLFDTDRGLDIMREVLAPMDLEGGVSIHFFAREKQDQTIVV